MNLQEGKLRLLHALSYWNALMVSCIQYTHRSPAILSWSNYPSVRVCCVYFLHFVRFPLISLASVGGYY